MDIKNKVDIWQNEGGDPGDLKQKGFEGGYYPPANIFNWLFNRHSVAIDELQNLLQVLSVDDIGAANNKLDNLENPTEASGKLLYRGTINASNAKKADAYTNIGIYKVYLDGVSGSDFNFPTPYGIFVVEAAMDGTSYDYVAQAFYSMGDNKFFTRTSSDNGATWLDWKQAAAQTDLATHTSNKKNPHGVNCEQLGAVPMENAIAAGTNLDTVVKSGMYRINESPVNAPADVAYGQMLVVHGGNDTIAQIVFPYNQSRMFFRTGNPSNTGGTGNWKDWTQVYTTFNKPTPEDIGALSKDGGTVGDLTISASNLKPVKVVNRASNSCYTHYSGANGALGFLGFSDTNKPAFLNAAGNEVKELYHVGNKPTKADIGLGNVPNVATNDQTPTYSDTSTLSTLSSGEKLNVALQKIKCAITNLINHLNNKSNPHGVTASQTGAFPIDGSQSTTGVNLYTNNKKGRVYTGSNNLSIHHLKNGAESHDKDTRFIEMYSDAIAIENAFKVGQYVNGTLTRYNLFGEHNKPYVTGSYTGNGAESRFINLGFTPSAVLLYSKDGLTRDDTAFGGGLALSNNDCRIKNSKGEFPIVSIVSNGFNVYDNSKDESVSYYICSNQNNETFMYIAYR
jgi:hypothetical protein